MVDGVTSLFGLRYVIATVTPKAAAAKVVASTQDFASAQFTQTSSQFSQKSKVVSQDLANQLVSKIADKKAENASSGSIGIKQTEEKHSLAVNLQATAFSGKSYDVANLVAQYNQLKASPGSAQIEYYDGTGKRSFTLDANSITTDDGSKTSLTGSSIAAALKGNQLVIDGTLKLDVSQVQGYTYKDANGAVQTQEGFSLVSYKFTDGAGKVQEGQFIAADNADTSKLGDLSDQDVSKKVVAKYSISNTTDQIKETPYTNSVYIQILDSDEAAARYKKSQDNALYLAAVNSVTHTRAIA